MFDRTLYMQKYNQKPNVKEMKRVGERKRRVENRVRLINLLGGMCNRCGMMDYRVLQLDHIKGGGTQHRKQFANNEQMVRHYVNNIVEAFKTFQILCANCNFIKRYENNEVTMYDMYSNFDRSKNV